MKITKSTATATAKSTIKNSAFVKQFSNANRPLLRAKLRSANPQKFNWELAEQLHAESEKFNPEFVR